MPSINNVSYVSKEIHNKIVLEYPGYKNDLKKHMISRGLKKMFQRESNNTIRPRRSHGGWINSFENKNKFGGNTPIFKLGSEIYTRENDFSVMVPRYSDKRQSTKDDLEATQTDQKAGKNKVVQQLETYCDKTTLHGLRYVGDSSLSVGERIFWFIAFSMAIGFAAYYISNIYKKWNTSPVIISFSPFDADLSSIPFPAITICNMNQAKKSEAAKILKDGTQTDRKLLDNSCKGNISFDESEETSWESVRNFLVKVGQSCQDTLKVCEWKSSKFDCETVFNNDLTDEGLCCSFNRLPPAYIFKNSKDISILNQTYSDYVYDWTPERGFNEKDSGNFSYIPLRPQGAGAHLGLTLILDTQVDQYYCSSTNSIGFKIILANPIETPKMADFAFLVSPGNEVRYSIVPSIREATDALRDIAISKRQCYFSNERPLQYYRAYTTRNCKQECQSNYTYELCQCVPYFLPNNKTMKICEKRDAECVQYAKVNMELTIGKASSCNCLPSCYEISYDALGSYATIDKRIGNSKDVTLNVSSDYFKRNMVVVNLFFEYSKYTKLIKREMHDFTDFLANTGGLLGVFMGFSFLSLVELIYHLSLRLCCIVLISKKKKTVKKKVEISRTSYPFTK